ncbi:hypothetical protein TVAG_258000, partial [Trichomonas vaginalis G3]
TRQVFQSLPSNRPIELVPQIRFVPVKTTSSSLRDSSSYNHLQWSSQEHAQYEGQTPAGDRKTDVLARAVQLVKTKTEIVDFILAACPYK